MNKVDVLLICTIVLLLSVMVAGLVSEVLTSKKNKIELLTEEETPILVYLYLEREVVVQDVVSDLRIDLLEFFTIVEGLKLKGLVYHEKPCFYGLTRKGKCRAQRLFC